ncbi:MAG: hypothetical protein KGI33_08865 [Thaumarchaeota archaeon]|nr:hypothetical protein [Nitrososphaerota archaeon]
MTSIGLDVGTGFVKCVSDTATKRFPSLYVYRHASSWEEKRGRIEAVGDEAVELSKNPDAVVIRPVMQGSPVNEGAFMKLVKKAVELVSQKKDAVASQGPDNLHIVIGLPYEARAQRDSVKRLIQREYRPAACRVVPQAIGTLVDAGKTDAIIVSVGQGTTEMVAFQKMVPVKGLSSHHAVSDISSRLDASKISYVACEIFGDSKAGPLVDMLADSIIDDLNSIRQDLKTLPVLFSGGGMMIPRLCKLLESKLSEKIEISQDPVMSNALGLFKLASQRC